MPKRGVGEAKRCPQRHDSEERTHAAARARTLGGNRITTGLGARNGDSALLRRRAVAPPQAIDDDTHARTTDHDGGNGACLRDARRTWCGGSGVARAEKRLILTRAKK